MGKTIAKALIDEIHIPIPYGFVENVCMRRGLNPEEEITCATMDGYDYKGALADCFFSLLTAVSFSESDKSIGALTDAQRKMILAKANELYGEIGEEEKEDTASPRVYVNMDL